MDNKDLMSPLELRILRKNIGVSLSHMAEILGLSGNNAVTSLRRMEYGIKPISMPMQKLTKYMQQGVSTGSMNAILPEFMIGSDLQAEIDQEWIFHTRYPRFLATVKDVDNISLDAIEWLNVAMWIDPPSRNEKNLLTKTAKYFLNYTKNG